MKLFLLKQDQLLEAKQCLQAASRLTEQLDQKNEKIGLLEEEGILFAIFTILLQQ